MMDLEKVEYLKTHIRDVPDFPKPGILFKDITPLLSNIKARRIVLDSIVKEFGPKNIQVVAAIEARGFIFGMLIAESLGVPFVPVRKTGKLPYKKLIEHYELEYGTSSIEIHEDSISKNARVLVHDDLLATGGTAGAASRLIQKLGAEVAGFSFIINPSFLSGKLNLTRDFGVEPHSVLTF